MSWNGHLLCGDTTTSKKGYDKMLGACFVPTCPDFIKAKFKCEKSHRLYDDLVERILEGETETQEENNG